MNQAIAVSAKDISKKYRLFNSHQERLKEVFHPFRKQYHREFWALKNIAFTVPKGHTVGILGRNGSGKSTLLQIIAGVLRPTSGSLEVNGRISALLELGAGFNPEFTGRDNVMMSGAIMGIPREEMLARMPLIADFADIGEFIDQPVKIYSSGMFARLAFAAAINVDPDILIVDEALAVGDAKFQHKCYRKFHDFRLQGKTILFVTHDVSALMRLCDYGIVLDSGGIYFQGPIAQATNCYQGLLFGGIQEVEVEKADEVPPESPENPFGDIPLVRQGIADNCPQRPSYNKNETRLGDGRVKIQDYAIVVNGQIDPPVIPTDAEIMVYVKLCFFEDVGNVSFGCGITTKDCMMVYGTNLALQGNPLLSGRKGGTILARIVTRLSLAGGDYFMNLGCNQVTAEQDTYLDVRRSIAHLRFADTSWCGGIVAFKSRLDPLGEDVAASL